MKAIDTRRLSDPAYLADTLDRTDWYDSEGLVIGATDDDPPADISKNWAWMQHLWRKHEQA